MVVIDKLIIDRWQILLHSVADFTTPLKYRILQITEFDFMSFDALNWAYNQTGLSCAEQMVLMRVADLYNEIEKKAWPSYRFLTTKLPLSESSIANHLKKLEQKKLLKIVKVKKLDGSYSSNAYEFPCYEQYKGKKNA